MESKLASRSFARDLIKPNLDDQMCILDIQIPENDDETMFVLPSCTWASLMSITHYLRIRLKIPFAKGIFVDIPLTIHDKQVLQEDIAYEELMASMPLISSPQGLRKHFAVTGKELAFQ